MSCSMMLERMVCYISPNLIIVITIQALLFCYALSCELLKHLRACAENTPFLRRQHMPRANFIRVGSWRPVSLRVFPYTCYVCSARGVPPNFSNCHMALQVQLQLRVSIGGLCACCNARPDVAGTGFSVPTTSNHLESCRQRR